MGIGLQKKGGVLSEEEQEERAEWLTEGLEPAEIKELMVAASSREGKAEPVDWDTLPEWLTEGMEETSWKVWGEDEAKQNLFQAEQTCLEEERDKKRWGRTEVAMKLAGFEQGYREKPGQRQLATELGVPRTTLQHWLKRKGKIDADPEVIAFFESPPGATFLHRLALGSHFVFTLMGPCGIRLVCRYLELTGLDQ